MVSKNDRPEKAAGCAVPDKQFVLGLWSWLFLDEQSDYKWSLHETWVIKCRYRQDMLRERIKMITMIYGEVSAIHRNYHAFLPPYTEEHLADGVLQEMQFLLFINPFPKYTKK